MYLYGLPGASILTYIYVPYCDQCMLCVDGGACGQAARMLEIGWGFAGGLCVPFFFFLLWLTCILEINRRILFLCS